MRQNETYNSCLSLVAVQFGDSYYSISSAIDYVSFFAATAHEQNLGGAVEIDLGGNIIITMSADDLKAEAAADRFCASCGIAEVDDIKLKECPDCDLVQYCSDNCQREHLTKHKATCKERAAELRDEILFRQPESSHHGDCPICFLPLSLHGKKSLFQSCCSKMICKGCNYANYLREVEESLDATCPFCRQPMPTTDEEIDRNIMKRVAANDPVAIFGIGCKLYDKGDYGSAFEYWTKAAGLGDIESHFKLSLMYRKGQGVEKDEKREIYHLEEAAIAGDPEARHNLGCEEWQNGSIDRAVKHWIIAANLGCNYSIQALKLCYADGDVSKEDFAAALRAHQAAVDATKSLQREEAAKNDAGGEFWKG